jgi:DNA-binding NtrC family response regulator
MNKTTPEQGAGMYRVVIVENDPRVTQALAVMLRSPQRSVEIYDSPDAALELLRDGPVDMAFISQKKPSRQTSALGERIKARCPGACVVYYAGHPDEQFPLSTEAAVVRPEPQQPSRFGEVLQLAHHHVEH